MFKVINLPLNHSDSLAFLNVDFGEERVFIADYPIDKSEGRFFTVRADWNEKTLYMLCHLVSTSLNNGESWESIVHTVQPTIDRVSVMREHLRLWVSQSRKETLRKLGFKRSAVITTEMLRSVYGRVALFVSANNDYHLSPYKGWHDDLSFMLTEHLSKKGGPDET